MSPCVSFSRSADCGTPSRGSAIGRWMVLAVGLMRRVGLPRLLGAVALSWATSGAIAATIPEGAAQRTQVLELRRGWNAVFLEVHPQESEPGTVFRGTPVDMVAAFHDRPEATQFVTDPSVDLFRREGWGVWYAPDRDDAFLSTLFAIHGQTAYLIHSKEAMSWTVRGAVFPIEIQWRPNAFNLVGFSVSESGAPTFEQFFRGSSALAHNRIYRLVEGSWQKVADPSGELMRSGESFWIYCDGRSSFQGPLRVRALTNRGLILASGTGDLVLQNDTPHPVLPKIEHLASVGDPVPLSVVIQGVGGKSGPVRSMAARKPAGPWQQDLPALESGRSIRVPFQVRVEEMKSYSQASLLRITTDLGTVSWVPVVGIRDDLKQP